MRQENKKYDNIFHVLFLYIDDVYIQRIDYVDDINVEVSDPKKKKNLKNRCNSEVLLYFKSINDIKLKWEETEDGIRLVALGASVNAFSGINITPTLTPTPTPILDDEILFCEYTRITRIEEIVLNFNRVYLFRIKCSLLICNFDLWVSRISI